MGRSNSTLNSNIPLKLDSVSFSYASRQILDNVTFEVTPGSFTVLLGINGAGKTTLFSLITRLFSPKSGCISVFGYDLDRHPSSAMAKMGVVFQNPTLDQDLTIKQNLCYHAALYGVSTNKSKRLVTSQMNKYLPDCQDNRKIHKLSGGQKRSVELMRSLMHQPQLLLLDEPTVGLDIKNRAQFIRNVRDLCKSAKVGVLWATHLIDEVNDTDNVVILHQSKVLFSGSVKKALQDCKVAHIGDAFAKKAGINLGNMK